VLRGIKLYVISATVYSLFYLKIKYNLVDLV